MKKELALTCSLFFISCNLIFGQVYKIITVAGNGTSGSSGDGGAATAAELNFTYGVAADASGNIYIADGNNNKIRKVNSSGIITTIAGNGTPGFSGDGNQATAAELNAPYGVAVDVSGNVYIADYSNNRIRKVNGSGIISTVAGNGTYGFSGDGNPATAAELTHIIGVAVDGSGDIYLADGGNNRIRKVNGSGIISTVAGNGTPGFSGDGNPATAAELNDPAGVAVDNSGNFYIVDLNNQRIRKVNGSGHISTIAGTGTPGFSGDGSPATAAELNNPSGVSVDDSGNVYIADYANSRIRKINGSGIINTKAGNGTAGFSGDGSPATSFELNYPAGLTTGNEGNIYIADGSNHRVREILVPISVSTDSVVNVHCNGENNGSANVFATGGAPIYRYLWSNGQTNATATGLTAGTYTVKVTDANVPPDTIIKTITITQPTAIIISSFSTPDNGSSNGTAKITASGGNSPYTYLWSPGGYTTDSISGKDSGTYCCKVTDASGCNDSICIKIKSIAGIQGIAYNSGPINVYPNPNSGLFTVESTTIETSLVEIYNILGEKVYTETLPLSQASNSINLTSQPNGVYLYRVLSKDGSIIGEGKMIIQK